MGVQYQASLNRLQAYLEEQGIDAALITSPVNIYYLTGFFSDPHERFMALVMERSSGRVSLFVPSLDEGAAQLSSSVKNIIPVADTDDPYSMLVRHLGSPVRSIGVEKKVMNVLQYERLAVLYPQAVFYDVEAFIAALRLKKSPEDIQRVRQAVAMVEKVLDLGVQKVVPGMTELELVAELEYQMKVLGADRPAFSTIVLSGARSALPHGHPGRDQIQQGEFLLFDLGVFVGGYCSDITRTFMVGQGNEKQKHIYETVLEANRKAISAVQAGQPIGTVDKAAREVIEKAGFGPQFTHRVGHGLGLEVHEAPSIHSHLEMKMEAGLLFTIEPGIYVPGVGGVRIEDDVYIGEDGQVEVLTSYPKEWRELG